MNPQCLDRAPMKPQDAPDGKVDTRTTSRAQRAVFKANRAFIDSTLVQRFDELMKPSHAEAGKQSQLNAIINSVIPRNATYASEISVKEQTVESMIEKIITHKTDITKHTLSKTQMTGQMCGGNVQLFESGLQSGDIQEVAPGEYVMWSKLESRQEARPCAKKPFTSAMCEETLFLSHVPETSLTQAHKDTHTH